MSDPLPTISEAEAEGPIAAVYGDIRATLGLPVVNLIWRHLAILPGCLEPLWQAVRPVYASGAAEAAAARLNAVLELPDVAPITPSALAAVGLSASDLAAIDRMLLAYIRGNALNAVALASLVAPPASPMPETMTSATLTQAAGPPLAPIPADGELAETTLDLVRQLDARGRGDDPIVASLYRHLALWPPCLALLHTALAGVPEVALRERIARNSRRVGARGGELAAASGVVVPTAVRAAAEPAIRRFLEGPLGRMVTMGPLVGRLLGA